MQVDILTPDATLFSGEAKVVTLPGVNGSFQIMNMHAPMISALSNGNVIVDNGAEKLEFPVKGGIIEVLDNKIVILAYVSLIPILKKPPFGGFFYALLTLPCLLFKASIIDLFLSYTSNKNLAFPLSSNTMVL
jgi:F-type H+-transporting ATPase subunit epsilon